MFAERTNRIGRNVGNFVQSRGGSLFSAGRRSTGEDPFRGGNSAALHPRSCNGDVVKHDYSRFFNPVEEDEEEATTRSREEDRQRSYGRNRRVERTYVRGKGVYLSTGEERVADGGMEMRPRRGVGDYAITREGGRRADVDSAKPIMVGNGRICSGSSSSTLPRTRGRTINFGDQRGSLSPRLGSRRGCPRRSLQELSDLELEDGRGARGLHSNAAASEWRGGEDRVASLDEESGWHRRRYGYGREDRLGDDDYLRLYRSLSRLSKYPQGGKYEPGQVHYERECRTFGKDTVAFIYYKTCYL